MKKESVQVMTSQIAQTEIFNQDIFHVNMELSNGSPCCKSCQVCISLLANHESGWVNNCAILPQFKVNMISHVWPIATTMETHVFSHGVSLLELSPNWHSEVDIKHFDHIAFWNSKSTACMNELIN